MTPDTFRALRDLIYRHSGILIREDMQYLMERRLGARLEALGMSGFGAYRDWLEQDGSRGELEAATEVLTTNETYFFRDPSQLEAFRLGVLPLLQQSKAHARQLRIWSAGCSSGEEAYTVAMLIHESGLFEGWSVEVRGTDISKRMLAAAARAEYGPSALRATDSQAQRRYFEPAGERMRVRGFIRERVSFAPLNLVDRGAAAAMDTCDAIFCRNVLIYFDLAARLQAMAVFYDRLCAGGFLLLGHAESLVSAQAGFESIRVNGEIVHRRPGGPR